LGFYGGTALKKSDKNGLESTGGREREGLVFLRCQLFNKSEKSEHCSKENRITELYVGGGGQNTSSPRRTKSDCLGYWEEGLEHTNRWDGSLEQIYESVLDSHAGGKTKKAS